MSIEDDFADDPYIDDPDVRSVLGLKKLCGGQRQANAKEGSCFRCGDATMFSVGKDDGHRLFCCLTCIDQLSADGTPPG